METSAASQLTHSSETPNRSGWGPLPMRLSFPVLYVSLKLFQRIDSKQCQRNGQQNNGSTCWALASSLTSEADDIREADNIREAEVKSPRGRGQR